MRVDRHPIAVQRHVDARARRGNRDARPRRCRRAGRRRAAAAACRRCRREQRGDPVVEQCAMLAEAAEPLADFERRREQRVVVARDLRRDRDRAALRGCRRRRRRAASARAPRPAPRAWSAAAGRVGMRDDEISVSALTSSSTQRGEDRAQVGAGAAGAMRVLVGDRQRMAERPCRAAPSARNEPPTR